VGLQLVGRRLQEEKILGLVELLSTALAGQEEKLMSMSLVGFWCQQSEEQ
jgi:hypothetical protein